MAAPMFPLRYRKRFRTPVPAGPAVLLPALLVLLTACGGSSRDADAGDLEVRDGKPVLSMYIQSSTTTPNPVTIDRELEELTGYIVEKTFLVADQATTSGIMLASGDYADILNMREDTQKFVDAGVFIPLQDLIQEHAPNISRMYEPYWNQMKARDGNVYTIPEIYPMNPERRVASSGPGIGMYVQKAVLEWAGYPNISDTAEMFALLKDYMAEYPEINGQSTIGFAFPAEGWRFGYTIYSPAYMYGYPNESGPLVDCIVNGEVDYEITPCAGEWKVKDTFVGSESYYNVLKQYNQAYLDDLIPKETVVQTHDQYNEKIASGRVLAVFDQGWEIQGSLDLLAREDPDRVLYNLPIAYDEDFSLYGGFPTPNYGAGFGISVNAVDPVAAVRYLDKSIVKEASLLTNWGIEGEDYEVDSQGRYYRTPEQLVRANDRTYRESHWGSSLIWVIQGIYDDGNAVVPLNQPSVYFASLSEGDREAASGYGVESMAELFPAPTPRRVQFSPLWTFTFDQDEDKEYLEVAGERDTLITEYTAKLIFAEEGEYESVWEEFNGKMDEIPNAGLWLETWQQRIDERIASWEG